jgi:uncharacterized protein (TIGR03435 family)
MIPKYLSATWAASAPTSHNHPCRSRLLALAAGTVAFALVNSPGIRAQSPPAPLPTFEVASIKPNRSEDLRRLALFQSGRYTMIGLTTKLLIERAYGLRDDQVSGGPNWISWDRYDVNAKVDDSVAAELQKLPPNQREEQLRAMLQALLADRFKLKVSQTTKDLPSYALVIAKNGPKLQEAKPGDTYPNGIKGLDGRPQGRGGASMFTGWITSRITGQGISVAFLAMSLSQQLHRTVTDQTGLNGIYDIKLEWANNEMPAAIPARPEGATSGADALPSPESSGPSLFTALEEQLGLKLESKKGPVEVLVIDHVERPSEN